MIYHFLSHHNQLIKNMWYWLGFLMLIKLLKQVNIIWWSEMDLFEIIPDTAVSSNLFENMLSMIVAVVRVILV